METIIQLSAGQFVAMIASLSLAMIGGFWWIGSRVQQQVSSDVRATMAEGFNSFRDASEHKYVDRTAFEGHVKHMDDQFRLMNERFNRIERQLERGGNS